MRNYSIAQIRTTSCLRGGVNPGAIFLQDVGTMLVHPETRLPDHAIRREWREPRLASFARKLIEHHVRIVGGFSRVVEPLVVEPIVDSDHEEPADCPGLEFPRNSSADKLNELRGVRKEGGNVGARKLAILVHC